MATANATSTMASSPSPLEAAHAPAVTSADDATVSSVSTSAVTSLALRVSGLPGALSDDAVRALLSHYGATRVRVLRRKKPGAVLHGQTARATQTAIAEFAERARRQDAQQRLAHVQLAGSRLTVEAIGSGAHGDHDADASRHEKRMTNNSVAQEQGETVDVATATGVQPRRFPPPPPPLPRANAPAPLAPHLGLHYAPSPMLQYKYPKATVPVVRNIANALIALPRFYTQVLHLMNKMNLPTPFEPGAIPGRFSEDFMPEKRTQRHRPQHHSDQLVEEDEEEDEEEEEPLERTHRDDARASTTKRTRHTNASTAVTGKKRPRVAMASPTASELVAFQPPRPGVISSAELDRQRLSGAARANDAAFAGHTSGVPSCRVQVTNMAESVDVQDLEYVFGHVLSLQEPLVSMRIERDCSTSIATVTFATLAAAERAVALIDGIVLQGQPLVVRYAELEPQPQPPVDAPLSATKADNTPRASEPSTEWERMDPTVLALEKAMKNYHRGDPTTALYLKNLARAVDENVLRALCRPLLPPSVSPDALTIRHFADGRMKNQAFIECPTPDAAEAVLEGLHGLVVHGKPLVVSFRKAQPSQAPPASTEQTT